MKYLTLFFIATTLCLFSACGGDDDKDPEEEMPMEMMEIEAQFEVEIDGVQYEYTSLTAGGSPTGDVMLTASNGTSDFFILNFEKDIEPGSYTTTGTLSAAVTWRDGNEGFVWQAQSGTINISENDATNGAIIGTIDRATLFEITQFNKEVVITNCKFTIPYTP